MKSIDLRVLPLASLTPAAYNPRKAPKPGSPAWKKLEKSLAEFGLVEPLVWNEATGHVVGGHMRMAILKHLGWTEAPVSVVRLSPEREKALNVILNNREAQGRFDADKLEALLVELEPMPEFELTGFDAGDLADLKMEPWGPLEGEVEKGRVEVTLAMPRECYERVSTKLDALVREFDLESHVKGVV